MSELLSTDLVSRLSKLQKSAETGKHYGFEQTIWGEVADEIKRLRSALQPFTTRDLMNVSIQDMYNARKALGLDAYGETP